MKLKSIFVSLVALIALWSCNKENETTGGQPERNAYLALAVVNNAAPTDRANSTVWGLK